jgi:hypothetical protein
MTESLSNPTTLHSEVSKLFRPADFVEPTASEVTDDDSEAAADPPAEASEAGTEFPAETEPRDSDAAKEAQIRSRVNTLDLVSIS